MRVCALIPAHNEAEHVAAVVRGAAPHVAAVLVVDDGSGDTTADRAREAGASVLRNDVNGGKGVALRRGYDWASEQGFDAAITLDADGQHDPGEIPRFLETAASTGADIVLGNRLAARSGMPFVRWWTNRIMSWLLSRVAGVPIRDSQVGFRLLRLAAWRRLEVLSCNFEFESEILVVAGRAGMRFAEVPVRTIYGDERSEIRPVTDTVRFFRMLLRLWRRPSVSSSSVREEPS